MTDAMEVDVRFADLPLDAIVPNPDQPRKEFEGPALEELAGSLRVNGLIQPIVVREVGDGYMLVAGERRWRAARMVGWETITAIIREEMDADSVEDAAIAENTARSDLNAMEECRSFRRLMDRGLADREVAARVGRSLDVVRRRLLLENLVDYVQRMVELKQVSTSKAEILARVDKSYQPVLMRAVIAGTTDEALIVMAETYLASLLQDTVFSNDPADAESGTYVEPVSEKAQRIRRSIDDTLEACARALNEVVDPRTLEVTREALAVDSKLLSERLWELEKTAKRVRGIITAAADAERSGVWEPRKQN